MPTIIQWTERLLAQIEAQTAYAAPFELRYRNGYVLPWLQREYADVYGKDSVDGLYAIQPPRVGTASVVVDALVERLNIVGATSSDARAADAVEQAWEANDLDVMHREAIRESLIKARSFAQVSRSADGTRAIVGIDAAEQMAVHREPGPPYDVDAALRIRVDEWTGAETARLWLATPSGHRAIDLVKGVDSLPDPEGSPVWSRWRPVVERTEPFRVPVVEFAATPRLLVEPKSEIDGIETHIDLMDLIEGLMLFAGHFGAVPIRHASGLEFERDKNGEIVLGPDGKPKIGFNPRADHLWASESADTEWGQFTPATLDGFVTWAQHVQGILRAKTKIASTYFAMDIKSHMSADLLKADEAPMVRRVNLLGREGTYNQAFRRLMELILLIEHPEMNARVRPRWESPGTRIETQDVDAFAKLAPSLGVKTTAKKVLGWSPAEVEEGAQEAADLRADGIDGAFIQAVTKEL